MEKDLNDKLKQEKLSYFRSKEYRGEQLKVIMDAIDYGIGTDYLQLFDCQRRIKNVRKRRLFFVVFRRSHVTFSSVSLLKKCVYDLLLLTHEFLAFFQPV